jgi:ATP-dependent Clp protease protease subunit
MDATKRNRLVAAFSLLISKAFLFAQPNAPRKVASQQEKDALLKRRTVRLEGVIEDSNANEVIARILYLQSLSRTQPIHLVIASPGGFVSPGLAIVDTLDQVGPPVFTHCDREARSMAAVILACGRAGSRSASADAAVSFSLPNAADPAHAAEAGRFGAILISKVAKATNRPIHQIRGLFLEAKPLSAQQALDLGIVDWIEGATKASK